MCANGPFFLLIGLLLISPLTATLIYVVGSSIIWSATGVKAKSKYRKQWLIASIFLALALPFPITLLSLESDKRIYAKNEAELLRRNMSPEEGFLHHR